MRIPLEGEFRQISRVHIICKCILRALKLTTNLVELNSYFLYTFDVIQT